MNEREAAREIVGQMSIDDRKYFSRQAWRESIDNMCQGDWEHLDPAGILEAIAELLEPPFFIIEAHGYTGLLTDCAVWGDISPDATYETGADAQEIADSLSDGLANVADPSRFADVEFRVVRGYKY
ncbi:MAG: hypothetical protein AVO35_13240 [Candidatus Aegiribacteria sp. MLS_C]|nr:MAG: hypothetical protein AVO35_13240 [Candidatus Aegiribacteria sp. MLS_C]